MTTHQINALFDKCYEQEGGLRDELKRLAELNGSGWEGEAMRVKRMNGYRTKGVWGRVEKL